MLVATVGILIWGVPTIQGLQQHAEYRSVLSQFQQLNADIQQLRDPKSSDTDTISMNRGQISLGAGGRWVFVGATAGYEDVHLTGWESDTATTVDLVGVPGAAGQATTIARYRGGTTVGGEVACGSVTSCAVPGTPVTPISQDAFRIRLKEGANIKADAWIFNVGRLQYVQSEGLDFNRLFVEMGAVVAQQGPALYMEESPLIKDPDFPVPAGSRPEDRQYFARVMELQGSSSTGGKGRFPIYVSLEDNYGVSRGRPLISDAARVHIQIDDKDFLEEAFCNFALSRTNYELFNPAQECDSGTAHVIYRPPPGKTVDYEVNHAVVITTVRTA